MKKTLKRLLPHPDTIKKHKYLSKLNLNSPNLWHFNRKSISKGVAVGLFCAFLPIPLQMVVASIFAVVFSANILISVALVWITNPLTIPPIFYFLYKLGAWILEVELIVGFDFSLQYITEVFNTIWQPLLLGSIIVSIVTSITGYYTINLIYLWRFNKLKKKRKA